MTAKELLSKQIEDVSYQLDKALDGITEAEADFKAVSSAMSARETIEHLCECYVAVEESTRGVEHDWGTFSVEDKSLANLRSQFGALRGKAIEAVTSSDDDKVILAGSGFMVAHDNYHVGQLCTLRIAQNGEWDAYCIYR